MPHIRRVLPLLLMVSAIGAITACSDTSSTAPLSPALSARAGVGDTTPGKICIEGPDGEIVCIDVHQQ